MKSKFKNKYVPSSIGACEMKQFVIGDIHGNYKALLQCIERSKIDKEKDVLISLGDVADSYPQVKECFDELMAFKKLIFILGNHDMWLYDWMNYGWIPRAWTDQGGKASISSLSHMDQTPYLNFLLKGRKFYLDNKNRLFVHGGVRRGVPIKEQDINYLLWDRSLIGNEVPIEEYSEVFIGHTTTERFGILEPMRFGNVWALDQGAGWSGKLTIMDVNTKEYWQSDLVKELYPGCGRHT